MRQDFRDPVAMDDILSELYTLEQLKVRRLALVEAYERLIASDKPISVTFDGRAYEYAPGSAPALKTMIGYYQAAIARVSGGRRRRPLNPLRFY